MIGTPLSKRYLCRPSYEKFKEIYDYDEPYIIGDEIDSGNYKYICYVENPLLLFEYNKEWKQVDIEHYYVNYSNCDEYENFMKKYFPNRKFKRKFQDLQTTNRAIYKLTQTLYDCKSTIHYCEHEIKKLKSTVNDTKVTINNERRNH